MNPKDVKAAAKADLETLTRVTYVYDAWEDRINVPCAVVVPDDQEKYLTLGTRFGSRVVNLRVFLIVKHTASRKKASEDLDNLIEEVLTKLEREWAIGGVDAPEAFTIGDVKYLGTSFQIQREASTN